MKHWGIAKFAGAGVLAVLVGPGRYTQPAVAQTAQTAASPERAFLNQYCVTCHNARAKTGGLALDGLDPAHPGENAETWEKAVRKLQAGMMPPSGAPRPDRAVIDGFNAKLEAGLDRWAEAHPNPGATALHRLNRNEYARAIKDLLSLDVDVSKLLPADDSAEGFDNVADVLRISPSLMERYVSAAAQISRLAVGDASIIAETDTYRSATGDSAGEIPLGTYGGLVVHHNFPLDGKYSFKVKGGGGVPYDNRTTKVEVTVNGEPVKEVEVGYYVTADFQLDLKAGPKTLAFTMVDKDPQSISTTWKVPPNSVNPTTVVIAGPLSSTGPGDTPSRRAIFLCKPGSASEELPCAKKILAALARRAYRAPATDDDLEILLGFYQRGRNAGGGFDTGIQSALERMLVSPRFVFRFEEEPAGLKAGAIYRIDDLELASRLSFFLWSSIPDDELLNLAVRGKLKDPAILEQQTLRMLNDPRADALVKNFAGQWLYLREVKSAPAPVNGELKRAFERETEMLFQSILRENRNVLDLLNADYTFVNERLARHYGIPNIYGDHFRRVAIKDDARRGLLGQGSFLLVTSVADRTSPVARGKWILENLLGTVAPVPPPNVPALEESAGKTEPRSVRQQMEFHRRNAVCASCHKIMDPIGLSLENFDLVGKWRDADQGVAIDASAELVDGTKLNGPASLRKALLNRSDVVVTTMTEKLMTYGIGRAVHYYDEPTIRTIVRNAAQNDYRFSSLILGIVKSSPFQMRVKSSDDPAGTRADARIPGAGSQGRQRAAGGN
jgi:mono/diheme cytochrome c family protein